MSEEQIARVYAHGPVRRRQRSRHGRAHGAPRAGRASSPALAASPSLRDVLANPQVEPERQAAHRRRAHARRAAAGGQRAAGAARAGAASPLVGDVAAIRGACVAEAELVEVEVDLRREPSAPRSRRRSSRGSRRPRVVGSRLAERVDPGIVGGLVLRVGDVIVDGSVRARIRQLRRRLATAEVRGDVE